MIAKRFTRYRTKGLRQDKILHDQGGTVGVIWMLNPEMSYFDTRQSSSLVGLAWPMQDPRTLKFSKCLTAGCGRGDDSDCSGSVPIAQSASNMSGGTRIETIKSAIYRTDAADCPGRIMILVNSRSYTGPSVGSKISFRFSLKFAPSGPALGAVLSGNAGIMRGRMRADSR